MSITAFLRTPVTRRAWAEIIYVVAGTPLAAVGVAYALASLVLGAGLAVTAAGIPLLALALRGARGFGAVHRGLAARLLGERVEPPAPPRPARGALGWLQAALSDGAGWRAIVYLICRFPLAVVQAYVVLLGWASSFVALTYPIQLAFGLNDSVARDAHGRIRHGLEIHGFHFDTFPRQLLISLAGLAGLLLAPWAVRGVVLVDRLLIRRLLGSYELTERVRDLEVTRARAVDDAAATLRRIERDLHDGAQVRLVALTMQLTMVRDAVPEGPAHELAGTALTTAREAIAELRELVRGIHPPVLDHGLDTALATLAASSGVPVELSADITARPTAAIESIAYFCAAELLANVAKHSGATRAWLTVDQYDDRLRLRVRDDGFGGAVPGAGSGLSGLRDRVRTVDGRMTVDSPPGGPTVVTVELPSHA